MNHSLPSGALVEQLARQLHRLGEEREYFLDTHFGLYDDERVRVGKLLAAYTSFLGNLLERPEKDIRTTVLIGSRVTCRYMDDGTHDHFTIVFPQEADPDRHRISFLSPVGRQLLMAKLGDVVNIQTPSGEMIVRVEGIEY